MNLSQAQQPTPAPPAADVPWSVAGLFLDALTRRDFDAMSSCMHRDVRFRALIPPGAFEVAGRAAMTDKFRTWFGGGDEFEVVDASIGQLGTRLYLRWRIEMRAAGDPASTRLVEQHAFATAGDGIEALDLLCSGFQAEGRRRS